MAFLSHQVVTDELYIKCNFCGYVDHEQVAGYGFVVRFDADRLLVFSCLIAMVRLTLSLRTVAGEGVVSLHQSLEGPVERAVAHQDQKPTTLRTWVMDEFIVWIGLLLLFVAIVAWSARRGTIQ